MEAPATAPTPIELDADTSTSMVSVWLTMLTWVTDEVPWPRRSFPPVQLYVVGELVHAAFTCTLGNTGMWPPGSRKRLHAGGPAPAPRMVPVTACVRRCNGTETWYP